jgi:hypothetical protein
MGRKSVSERRLLSLPSSLTTWFMFSLSQATSSLSPKRRMLVRRGAMSMSARRMRVMLAL